MKEVTSWVNGSRASSVDVSERAVQYGDGLFETIRIRDSKPEFLQQHMQRLMEGCGRLKFPAVDWDVVGSELSAVAVEYKDAVMKLILSRRCAARGYRLTPDQQATRIVSVSPLPQWPSDPAGSGIRVRICDARLSAQPLLAGIKHLNRLEQVLARSEWDDDAIAEGLMLNDGDQVIEGTMTNVFMVSNQVLVTPGLSSCGVAGVMRSVILDLAKDLGIETEVRPVSLADVRAAQEVLVCNSLIGVWPVVAIDQLGAFECGPLTRQLQAVLSQCDTAADGDWYSW
jgi:4-amino-4-deoxychorismate lyase